MLIRNVKGFVTTYPGLVRMLRSKISIGHSCLNNEEAVNFEEEFFAVWDTGAMTSCIKNSIAVKYDLPIRGELECTGVNGTTTVNTYLASLTLPNNAIINEIVLCSCDDSCLCDILIGMDIITKGEFLVSTYNNLTTYSFQMPAINLSSLDRIVFRGDIDINFHPAFYPDMLCPCGSKIKFSDCCSLMA